MSDTQPAAPLSEETVLVAELQIAAALSDDVKHYGKSAADTLFWRSGQTITDLLVTIAAKDAEILQKIDALNEAVTMIGGLEDSVRTLQAIRKATEAERDALKAEVGRAHELIRVLYFGGDLLRLHHINEVQKIIAALTPKESTP